MCGIFGSIGKERFCKLYEQNIERGTFASGIIEIFDDITQDVKITKREGLLDIKELLKDSEAKYFIGHTQAPTSSAREYSVDTSHPFVKASWAVVHNGVLTNSEELTQNLCLDNDNPVDTAVIPHLLQHLTETQWDVEPNGDSVVKQTLEKLKGTFGLCIIDLDSKEMYLSRQGSILFYSDTDFSTLPQDNMVQLEEGTILSFRDNWQKIDQFKTSSPFLFI